MVIEYPNNDYLRGIDAGLDKFHKLCFLKFTSKKGKVQKIGEIYGESKSISGGKGERPICLFGESKILTKGKRLLKQQIVHFGCDYIEDIDIFLALK